jgi:LysM repeat protein
MNQRFSAPARALAVIALICGFLVFVVVIVGSLSGGGGSGGGKNGGAAGHAGKTSSGRHIPKTYVVQNGDTLTSIAHKTGVSVTRILRLNPGVDPQILVSGEELTLR